MLTSPNWFVYSYVCTGTVSSNWWPSLRPPTRSAATATASPTWSPTPNGCAAGWTRSTPASPWPAANSPTRAPAKRRGHCSPGTAGDRRRMPKRPPNAPKPAPRCPVSTMPCPLVKCPPDTWTRSPGCPPGSTTPAAANSSRWSQRWWNRPRPSRSRSSPASAAIWAGSWPVTKGCPGWTG